MTTSDRPVWTSGSTSTADSDCRTVSTAGQTRYSYGEMCDRVRYGAETDQTVTELLRTLVISQMAVVDRLDRLCELMARSR